MKTLYIILKKNSNPTTFGLLQQSAEQRGITVKPLYTEEFNFSESVQLTSNDAVYRISTDETSSLIEKYITNESTISLYTSLMHCIGKLDNVVEGTLMHEKMHLPIIPTIFSPSTNKDLLSQSVHTLGGFPLIVKTRGGMHGVGVIQVDSLPALSSLLDYFNSKKETVILRKYIPHTEQARLIVLGNKVIASHANFVSTDFRTNAAKRSDRKRSIKTYDDHINTIAVQAVHALGYECGGVDILFDTHTQTPYIAEVNFPCFFARTQQMTGIDISGAMIDFLIEKSNKKITLPL